MTDHSRWCVYVPGPDELYAERSKEDAERAAREHNDVLVPRATAKCKENPNFPSPECVTAVVVEWPYGPVSDEEWEAMCAEDEVSRA